MEIDHLTIPVRTFEVGKRFYADALEPLGFRLLLDWPDRRRVADFDGNAIEVVHRAPAAARVAA